MDKGLNEDENWRRRSAYSNALSSCHKSGLERQDSPITTEQTQLPQSYSGPLHSMVQACHDGFSRPESPLAVLTSTSEGRWAIERGVDEDDWTIHRPIIEQLYIGEDVHLKDVIKIMEKRFNFKATPKMYKTQFTRWKVGKYYKANQKQHLAETAKLYHDSGRSIFTMKLGSQPVKLHRVRRFCKERNIMPDLSDHLPTRPTSSLMVELSPQLRASQLPNKLLAGDLVQADEGNPGTPPEELQMARSYAFDRPFSLTSGIGRVELVLIQTRNYLDYFKLTDDATLLRTALLPREHPQSFRGLVHGVENLGSKLQLGVTLLAQQKFKSGWKCMHDACQIFQTIIQRPPLHLLRIILDAFSGLHWLKFPELKAKLLIFFAKASVARLGCHHPLSILLFHLQEEVIFVGSIESAYRIMMHSFESREDLTADEVWRLRDDFVNLFVRRDDHATAASCAQQFLNETEAWWGNKPRHVRPTLFSLASSHYQQGLWALAAAECKELIKQGIDSVEAGMSSSKFMDATSLLAYQLLAWVSERRGDVVQSEQCWLEVLTGLVEIWGRDNDMIIICVDSATESLADQGIDAREWLRQNFGWSLGDFERR